MESSRIQQLPVILNTCLGLSFDILKFVSGGAAANTPAPPGTDTDIDVAATVVILVRAPYFHSPSCRLRPLEAHNEPRFASQRIE